ncbi:MAG: Mobile element protein [Nitrospira sp.]|nr:MAG: Mobile element protein [Nitrospira sp.]
MGREATIAEHCAPQVGANIATTVSKKSGAVQTLENDFLEGALSKAGLLSAKR